MVDRYNQPHVSQYREDCSTTTRVYGCTWTVGANGVSATTGGRYRPSPDKVHSMVRSYEETDPTTRGWSIPDLALACDRMGVGFDNKTGDLGWDGLIKLSNAGHYIALQGDSDVFDSEGGNHCSGAFDGPHCLGLHPDHGINDKGQAIRAYNDPICKERHWELESVLYRYASRFGGSIRFGAFTGVVPIVGSTPAPKPGDAMASAIRSESRRLASDSVVAIRAGSTVWADEKKTRAVRKINERVLVMDMGVPYGAGGFRAVRLLSGQFDSDDDREGGIGLVDQDDCSDPRPATAEELAAIRRLFA